MDQPVTVHLSFVNPLNRTLTGCEFRVTSSGIAGRTHKIAAPDAGPHELVSAELPVKPTVRMIGISNIDAKIDLR